MTRPEQPAPYPGDVGGAATPEQARQLQARPEQPAAYPGDTGAPVNESGRPPIHREYRDALGRALVGVIVIRDEATDASITRPLVGGVLDVPLQPGSYRLIASLTTADGEPWYWVETLTVGAYW